MEADRISAALCFELCALCFVRDTDFPAGNNFKISGGGIKWHLWCDGRILMSPVLHTVHNADGILNCLPQTLPHAFFSSPFCPLCTSFFLKFSLHFLLQRIFSFIIFILCRFSCALICFFSPLGLAVTSGIFSLVIDSSSSAMRGSMLGSVLSE